MPQKCPGSDSVCTCDCVSRWLGVQGETDGSLCGHGGHARRGGACQTPGGCSVLRGVEPSALIARPPLPDSVEPSP